MTFIKITKWYQLTLLSDILWHLAVTLTNIIQLHYMTSHSSTYWHSKGHLHQSRTIIDITRWNFHTKFSDTCITPWNLLPSSSDIYWNQSVTHTDIPCNTHWYNSMIFINILQWHHSLYPTNGNVVNGCIQLTTMLWQDPVSSLQYPANDNVVNGCIQLMAI